MPVVREFDVSHAPGLYSVMSVLMEIDARVGDIA